VESAKLELTNNYQETAYYLALHAGELALKSVLVKCGVFDEDKDKHHNMITLLQKIEHHNCLPRDVQIKLRTIIESRAESGLSHVDVATPQGLTIDCEAAMTSRIRYPIGNDPPSQYITTPQAKDKVILADELVSILERSMIK
jgi:hypothetical protein